MRTTRLLPAAALVLFACTSSTPPFAPAHPVVAYPPEGPVVLRGESFVAEGDVRVLAEKGLSWETTAAVSPHNPRNAVVGVIERSTHHVDTYVTHDAGHSWIAGSLPVRATNGRDYPSQGDPVVVADRTGVFHYGVLVSNARNTAVAATRSLDGGLTWSAPVIIAELTIGAAGDRQFDDKEWMAVDDTGGAYDGHVYLLWQRITFGATPLQSRMMFARSTDRGATWSEPVFLTDPATGGQSMVDVGPDGEVYLAYFRSSGLWLRKSTDGGATFGAPAAIPSLPWIGGAIPNTRTAQFRAFPQLLCDRSNGPHRGTLYLVHASSAPGTPRYGGVALTKSTDGGATWTTPRFLFTPAADAILPSGAVDQTTGELAIAWLDRRDDPTNTLARLYAMRSKDGGATFETPRGFTPQFSIDADWIGDYYGMAGNNANWIATFSPASGQMSAVRLRFDDTPTPPAKKRRSSRH
ncbi:MAG TPA: sialidase family protein [Thermoanaerobaculia bacterium]|jgi:hypothetical protein